MLSYSKRLERLLNAIKDKRSTKAALIGMWFERTNSRQFINAIVREIGKNLHQDNGKQRQ